jgi:hypothetical protein
MLSIHWLLIIIILFFKQPNAKRVNLLKELIDTFVLNETGTFVKIKQRQVLFAIFGGPEKGPFLWMAL